MDYDPTKCVIIVALVSVLIGLIVVIVLCCQQSRCGCGCKENLMGEGEPSRGFSTYAEARDNKYWTMDSGGQNAGASPSY